MFNIAICDDDKEFCTWFSAVLYNTDLLIPYHLTIYHSGAALCKQLKAGVQYDLIFLDIQLNETDDGIGVGQFIRQNLGNYHVEIVYISYSTQYALRLFQNHPFDFLTKPLEASPIANTINKIMKMKLELDHVLEFSIKKQPHIVKTKDILYITSNLRKIVLCTQDQKYEFYGKLDEVAKRLPGTDFIMTHKSFLVNWAYVKEVHDTDVELLNGTKIPLSRSFKKEVMNIYCRYAKEHYDNK